MTHLDTAPNLDRDEVFLELTRSICPVCKTTIDAEVNVRDNQVFLRKRCAEHGEFEARVYGDAQMYVDIQRFNKPGSRPLQTQTEVRDGCPSDCGLCPEHKQHACLGIIEVNTGCNLDCPICFADSGSPRDKGPDGYSITLDQCATMLDVFVAAEGEPEVVMFSGGEPTIHKDILAMIDLAQERPISAVNLNTNGIRLASDKRFVAELGRRNRPGRRVNIYLQFDGLEAVTHTAIRGRDLREIKQRALDNCAEVGLTVTLVAAIEKDLNEHEIGAIIRHGLGHPAVRSVAFQPVTHSGRHVEFDPLTRLTNSDVLHAIAAQLPQWFTTDDFFPVPCCAPTCRAITYLITQGHPDDEDFGLVPVPRLLQVEDYLDYVSNRVVPDYAIREALEKLWSASAFVGTETNDDRLTKVAEALDCADACGVNLPEALAGITENAFMIVVQDFQDPYTLNVRQLMKCCVEEITPDGRLIPFCAYNSVGYREEIRAKMSGVEVAPVVPNALPLQPVLVDGPYGAKRTRAMTTDQTPASVHGGAETIKACCAVGYSSDLVSMLLGESYHPGGLALTRRLLDQLGLAPGRRLLDVASGIGTTALLAATEYDALADGVDLSPANVSLSTGAAAARGLADRVTFHPGDAEALPLADGGWDAVVCECALCTFPDKQTAVAEMARVLKPGGRIGITDMTAKRDRLPPELTTLQAWIACIADARTADENRDLLAGAGMRVLRIEHHQVALERMIRQIEARLELLRITSRPRLEEAGIDFTRVQPVLGAAHTAVRDGILGYVLIVAEKTATGGPPGGKA